jgi:hypothetical protein
LRRFQPILWVGLANAFSGVLLLIGYPTKALTNPVFYLKLGLIAAAMALLVRVGRRAFDPTTEHDAEGAQRLRRMAIASLVCWAGAITAGRLLAYTYSRLTQSH